MRRIFPLLLLFLVVSPALAADDALKPGDHTFTLKAGGVDRIYILHVPKKFDGKTKLPLVMMIHGGGGSAKNTSKRYGWREKSDAETFLAVFPEATPLFPNRPSSFRDNPNIWNDGSGRGIYFARKPDDLRYIGAVLDDVTKRAPVDADRVYCTGFSNGASMTWYLASMMSERFAAAAPVSGHLWVEAPKPKRLIPVLFMTGAADPLNPLKGGMAMNPWGRDTEKPPIQRSIDRWVAAIGAEAKPEVLKDEGGVRTVRYGPGRDGAELIFTLIEGLGHVWPGGREILPRAIVGEGTDKINATDVIWDFFKKHKREKKAGGTDRPEEKQGQAEAED